jgi:hypothetical protein
VDAEGAAYPKAAAELVVIAYQTGLVRAPPPAT